MPIIADVRLPSGHNSSRIASIASKEISPVAKGLTIGA
jgi:hypothetical protein